MFYFQGSYFVWLQYRLEEGSLLDLHEKQSNLAEGPNFPLTRCVGYLKPLLQLSLTWNLVQIFEWV